jgi:hypothetical protein
MTDHRLIAILDEDGETSIHAASGYAGYHTMCGLSADDDTGSETLLPAGAKIDCAACWDCYCTARSLSARMFAGSTKRSAA